MRRLEKIYSKSDRIIAKAKFSYWVFSAEVILALFLGAVIACLWIFGLKIEQLIRHDATECIYLTTSNLKWAILGAGGLVLLISFMHGLSFYSREMILTEDKLIYHVGLLNREIVTVQLYEIVNTQVNQGPLQTICNVGTIEISGSGGEAYVIRHIVAPDKFARRVIHQATAIKRRVF